MSFQVLNVKGIPIKFHFTLVIVFLLIAWTLASGFMPRYFPNLSTVQYWIMGIAGAIILFISVLVHELAHSILSLKYGLKVRQIILFIFGGVSDIKEEERLKQDYGKEFKIAVVGPLTSFALAGLFALSWWILLVMLHTTSTDNGLTSHLDMSQTIQSSESKGGFGLSTSISQMVSGILFYAIIVNVLLGAFNLLPAFPLDGGRILRAGLMRWNKSYDDATKISVKVGAGISYGLMAFGFISIIGGGSFIGGFWLILIGWFLQSGSQAYLQQQEISTALSGVHLRDIMNTRFVSVRPDITVKELLNNFFNLYRKSEFPVTIRNDNFDDILVGTITTKQAMQVPESDIDRVKVEKIMTQADQLIIMGPDRQADEALKRIYHENKSRVFVCTASMSKIAEDRDIFRQKKEIARSIFSTTKENSQKKHLQNLLPSGSQQQQPLKLIGIISKTDILNVAKERQEYEKYVRK